MAHKEHNIPWKALASNLQWAGSSSCYNGATNLHPRFSRDLGKELTHFVEGLVRAIDEDSKLERSKYPERYDPPERDDLILDDRIVRKISPTILQLDIYTQIDPKLARPQRCQHRGHAACKCTIPCEERLASSFLRKWEYNDCYQFFEINGDAFFNLEVVKTLLLHGEMDPILRVCAHPDVDLASCWSRGQCYDVVSNYIPSSLICLTFSGCGSPDPPPSLSTEACQNRGLLFTNLSTGF